MKQNIFPPLIVCTHKHCQAVTRVHFQKLKSHSTVTRIRTDHI